MSSDDHPGGPRIDGRTASLDATFRVTPQLLKEAGQGARDRTPEDVMSRVGEALFDAPDGDVTVDEELVTQSLDEILLALIELREDDTHGTGLMEDMATLFGVRPSPGTVYPRLHDLDAAGVLARHDLVQTKQYMIDDEAAASDRIESAMYEHLALGLFFRAVLESS